VEGTRRLVEACAERGVAVAFASSLAVVGAPERLPVTEETPARPTHEYGRQKAAAEEIVAGLGRRGNAPSAVLRMSNVYGGYSVDGRTVAKGNVLQVFARQVREGRLTVNAPGSQRRDFIHLDDVLSHWEGAVRRLADASLPRDARTFNVASGQSLSVLEVAGKVVRRWTQIHSGAATPQIEIVRNPREGVELVEPEFTVSRERTQRELGVVCRHSVDGALDELLSASPGEEDRAPGRPAGR
ncbi:MAG: NAD-dependent epimerase/dehydratase family protein, partial [Thermoplasmata archaeon]